MPSLVSLMVLCKFIQPTTETQIFWRTQTSRTPRKIYQIQRTFFQPFQWDQPKFVNKTNLYYSGEAGRIVIPFWTDVFYVFMCFYLCISDFHLVKYLKRIVILYDLSGHKPDLEGKIQICFRYGFSRPVPVYKHWDSKSARPDPYVSTQKAGIRKPALSSHWESRFFQTCHLSKIHGGQV